MAERTEINYLDSAWNVVTGCTPVSAGCAHCYARRIHDRRHKAYCAGKQMPAQYASPFSTVQCLEDRLDQPLRWRRPRRIGVCFTGDLFHQQVPDSFLDKVFAVMALAPQHQFFVLTKRPERMREYCSAEQAPFRVAQAMDALTVGSGLGPEEVREVLGYPGYFVSSHGIVYSEKRGHRRRMKPDAGEQGHQRVQLHREGSGERGDRLLVHRLVLETFVGPPQSDDAQVLHRDGNPAHNAVTNLSWGGQDANWTDSKRHGSHRRYSKLTPEQVTEIRSRCLAGETGEALAREFGVSATQVRNIASFRQWNVPAPIQWPLVNTWAGISVEDQATADSRIPILLQTPAARRWVSYEPALGPVTLRIPMPRFVPPGHQMFGADDLHVNTLRAVPGFTPALDWVVVGGESGPGARPCDPSWLRNAIGQCKAAGVPAYLKQVGANVIDRNDAGFEGDDEGHGPTGSEWPIALWADDRIEHDLDGTRDGYQGAPVRVHLRSRSGSDPSEWPEDLRCQELPR